MKWFHHECAAKHDPKLQTLGASHGAEGLGIFWGLLEEIGQHSDTFHLKISGLSAIADRTFDEILQDAAKAPTRLTRVGINVRSIPRFPLKILAKILFTSPQKLDRVIQSAIETGLFDKSLWSEYSILYSPSFEQRADDYTRRVHRRQHSQRTLSGQSSERTCTSAGEEQTPSDNVSPEQTTTETEKRKREQSRCEPSGAMSDLGSQKLEFRRILAEWNTFRVNPFVWNPTESELERLFLGGDERHKEALRCAWGGLASYPEIVLQALRQMLEASEQRRIANPAGWIWSCLHGNGEGTGPWIHMLKDNRRT